MKGLKVGVIFVLQIVVISWVIGQGVTTHPAFKLDFVGDTHLVTPTADKPQSKLWYFDSRWWVILPDVNGLTLWERTTEGWRKHEDVSENLKGIHGFPDVWYEDKSITAVCVSDIGLTIIRLYAVNQNHSTEVTWKVGNVIELAMPLDIDVDTETATLARDNSGVWWVSADVGRNVYVWASSDATIWGEPILIGKDISADDISAIATLEKSIIVFWSDQNSDAFYSREHLNGEPVTNWEEIVVIDSGGRTADDHINHVISSDGTLWVNTKNSLDEVGSPNLVMRILHTSGTWKNYPYLKLEKDLSPSRPVVVSVEDSHLVMSGFTLYDHRERKNYDEQYDNKVRFGVVNLQSKNVLVATKDVISPDLLYKSMINNITGPKAPFPKMGEWIILASDNQGNVYEADLRLLFHGQ